MNKYILILIFLFPAFTNLKSQNTNTQTQNSLLWEISGNELKTKSYIFGTIHLIPEKDYFFSKKMNDCFKSCKVLAMEVDLNIPLSKQIEIAQTALLPNNKTLANFISEAQYSRFYTYLADTLKIKKRKINQISKIKPIYSSALILNELLEKPVTYEKELNKKAKKNKMELVGLETLDTQINILEKIDLNQQIKYFCTPDTFVNPLDEYNIMLQTYKNQEIDSMIQASDFDDFMSNIEYEILEGRNRDWIPKIEKLIHTKPTFIAVGAAHLPGETGILELLRKQGYTIKAVK